MAVPERVQLAPRPAQLSLQQQLADLQAENARLREARTSSQRITLKVAAKGGLSAYGLGRWPVTLYREQWRRLLAEAAAIEAFIVAHDDQLASKQV